MVARLRLALAAALLSTAGCAHRSYYVYGPETEETARKDVCRLDFRSLTLGGSTVADLRRWYDALRSQPDCDEVTLRFHRPGEELRGDGFQPADSDVVRKIAIDNNPERTRLSDPAVVRAVVAPHDKCVDKPGGCVTTIIIEKTLTRTVTEYVPRDPLPPTIVTEYVDRPAPYPVYACSGSCPVPKPTDTKTEVPGPPGKDAETRTIREVLPPAIVGGSIVYALAYLQLLPLGAAGVMARPRPRRPQWDLEDPDEVPAGAAPGDGPELLRDRRVRVRATGFRKGEE